MGATAEVGWQSDDSSPRIGLRCWGGMLRYNGGPELFHFRAKHGILGLDDGVLPEDDLFVGLCLGQLILKDDIISYIVTSWAGF